MQTLHPVDMVFVASVTCVKGINIRGSTREIDKGVPTGGAAVF